MIGMTHPISPMIIRGMPSRARPARFIGFKHDLRACCHKRFRCRNPRPHEIILGFLSCFDVVGSSTLVRNEEVAPIRWPQRPHRPPR
jgi:hypothetical protein